MTTLPIPSPTSTSSTSQTTSTNKLALKPEDFIKMMVTQLQQQDPMEPAKSDQLLAQMSEIGQLQSSTQLQDSLKGLVLQNQISSSATLIGKTVQGLDTDNTSISGIVNSVRVQDDGVSLELDNGKTLSIGRVTSIAPGLATSSATTPKAA